jgi:DNA repair exonuclease SbcCD ATPase subunit
MSNPWLPVMLALALAVPAPAKPKAGPSSQLQAQIKKLTQERDELKERLAATESLQEDLAAAQKSRDLSRQESEAVRKQLDEIKGALAENQGSADSLLKGLQKAKEEAAANQVQIQTLKDELAKATEAKATEAEKAVQPLTPEITPAKPMNLNRITPKVRKVTGVVVVNVLVSENGEVLDSRLLQGLPGEGEWVQKANEACVEAAKRIVFDPARGGDGKTKVRVWQGVGFLLD